MSFWTVAEEALSTASWWGNILGQGAGDGDGDNNDDDGDDALDGGDDVGGGDDDGGDEVKHLLMV